MADRYEIRSIFVLEEGLGLDRKGEGDRAKALGVSAGRVA